MGLLYVAPPNLQLFRPAQSNMSAPQRDPEEKTGRRGPSSTAPWRPESLRLVLAFGPSSVLCEYHPWLRSHLDLAARLIRFFRQLEQHPHQFRVIQRLLPAEEPILDETVHRRLGAAKFG
jgi:hypothetical protein